MPKELGIGIGDCPGSRSKPLPEGDGPRDWLTRNNPHRDKVEGRQSLPAPQQVDFYQVRVADKHCIALSQILLPAAAVGTLVIGRQDFDDGYNAKERV